MTEISIVSVNISEQKGTVKHPVPEIVFTEKGIQDDAHSGEWHRQVSLLGTDSIKKFSTQAKRKVGYGEFAENITTEGMKVYNAQILDRFVNENNVLEVTQIGKKCHGAGCNIYQEVGNCVMPKEGIFCRVIKGNKLKPGDKLKYLPHIFKIAIISTGKQNEENSLKNLLYNFFNEKNRKTEVILEYCNNNNINDCITKFATNNYDAIFVQTSTEKKADSMQLMPVTDNNKAGFIEKMKKRNKLQNIHEYVYTSLSEIRETTLVFNIPQDTEKAKIYANEIKNILIEGIYTANGL